MKNLKFILIILIVFVLASCGKKDEKVGPEKQDSTQNLSSVNKVDSTAKSDSLNIWIGQYTFEESAKNVTGTGAQTWNYIVDVKAKEDKSVIAEIQIDGFQTMSRIEAEVKGSSSSADFIFTKYLPENMFEIYKKGDKLFTLQLNSIGEIITNWDKMKPNVIYNKKSGKVMFKKVIS